MTIIGTENDVLTLYEAILLQTGQEGHSIDLGG
jgi:hypothetical protein